MEYGAEPMTTIFVPQHAPAFNELGYDNIKLSGYSIPAFDYGKKLKNFKSSTPQILLHNHHNPLWGIKDWELDLRRLGRSTAPLLFYFLKIFHRLVYF